MWRKIFTPTTTRNYKSNIIGALDIGTGTVSCLLGHFRDENAIDILGAGQASSKGFERGTITDMEALLNSINHAVEMAEETARQNIQGVYVNLAPSLCRSNIVEIELPILGHEVELQDIERIVQQACQFSAQNGYDVIHAIPIAYKIDHASGIKDPRGMFGEILHAKIHIIETPMSILKNIMACVEKAHLQTLGFVCSQYAAGLACLEKDEMKLGTIVVDMGADTTGLAIFAEGDLKHVETIKVGGTHITKDISRGLSTPLSHAERVKVLYGTLLSSSIVDRENIIIPQIGEKKGKSAHRVPKSQVTNIIRPRVEEMFELIQERLKAYGLTKLSGHRIVLTGGASQLSGIKEICSIITNRPVRLGYPIHVNSPIEAIENPTYAVCAGILTYAQTHLSNKHHLESQNKAILGKISSPIASIRLWLREKM